MNYNEKRYYYKGEPTDYLIRDNGSVWSEKRGRLLVPTTTSNEYLRVQIKVNKKPVSLMVHRLVAETFIPNPNNLEMVHHIDGNKYNNDVSNLMWVTNKENQEKVLTRKKPEKIAPNFDDYEWTPISINNNYGACKEGYIANLKNRKVLLGGDRNGYKRVVIENKVYSIHRIIYATFVGEIPEKGEIDHIDGDRGNNNINNLRLTSRGGNMDNAYRNGHKASIRIMKIDPKTDEVVQTYNSIRSAAKENNINYDTLRMACARESVSGGYRWKRQEE